MKFPTVKEVFLALMAVKADACILLAESTDDTDPQDLYIEVRLQVYDDNDGWEIHTGSAQYDDEHTGFWGADYVGPESDLLEVARGLIEEAKDHAEIAGEVD